MEKNNKSGECLFILSGNSYFCAMIRNLFSFLIILFFSAGITAAQAFVSTSDLFKRTEGNYRAGQLKITQDHALDTLITRYILASENHKTSEGTQGMDGYRIQIYYSSVRTAREEASRARAEFLSKFPDIKSYEEYAEPGYFMVRAGDFRTNGGMDDLLGREKNQNAIALCITFMRCVQRMINKFSFYLYRKCNSNHLSYIKDACKLLREVEVS